MTDDQPKGDRYISPGTKVRLDSFVNSLDEVESEYGIVVHCWMNQTIGFYDCYVAFFGDEIPAAEPAEQPYLLRYAAAVLATIP